MTFLYLSWILFDIKMKNFASIREQNGRGGSILFQQHCSAERKCIIEKRMRSNLLLDRVCEQWGS
jgi:hypothetical protein